MRWKRCIRYRFLKLIGFKLSEYVDNRPGDVLLEVGGNTGKGTEAFLKTVKS